MGCFSGRLMSAASDQKLFCKVCSPFCCSFDEFVEEKVISPSYSSAILTPPREKFDRVFLCLFGLPPYPLVFIVSFVSLFFDHAACGILVPQPGIEPMLPAVKAES